MYICRESEKKRAAGKRLEGMWIFARAVAESSAGVLPLFLRHSPSLQVSLFGVSFPWMRRILRKPPPLLLHCQSNTPHLAAHTPNSPALSKRCSKREREREKEKWKQLQLMIMIMIRICKNAHNCKCRS